MQNIQIEQTIRDLYRDSKNDHFRMIQGAAKSILRPLKPVDFKHAYLSISQDQGADLAQLIVANDFKNIVEFGTSFGISTLFLAKGAKATGGSIITTELINSKAEQAVKNFEQAGVNHLIDVRVGDALQTLSNHSTAIDLLVLDGWKDLYLPIFQMLEPNYHPQTIVYVDNADMAACRAFLDTVTKDAKYTLEYVHGGKAAIVTVNR